MYHTLSGWLRTHPWEASLLILLCSTTFRFFLAWRADAHELLQLYSDGGTYLNPAMNLLDKGAFLDGSGAPMIDRTPGYPAFLAGIMLLVGRNLREIMITQAMILSFGAVFLYCFGRRVLPPVMAFTGGLIAAFSPWGAVLAGIPMSDGLFLLLLTLIFFVMKLTEGAHSSKLLLGGSFAGLLTGAAVLVRPLWPLVIFIPVAFLFCYGPKRKGAWILLSVTLLCAATPVELWRQRNEREAQFAQLTDITGKTAWRYLAARVLAEINDQNRHDVATVIDRDDRKWSTLLTRQEADDERWRRAKAVFTEHPYVTAYSFMRSAIEHAIHPSPDVLRAARLDFTHDLEVLGILWGGLLLMCGYAGFRCRSDPILDDGRIEWRWLLAIAVVCLILTLLSGLSFAAGSRLRAPLEAIVPLMAAIGLVRVVEDFIRA
jgi:Dolichyl-phosphate-mannose-protein mannosyltransferase